MKEDSFDVTSVLGKGEIAYLNQFSPLVSPDLIYRERKDGRPLHDTTYVTLGSSYIFIVF